MQRTINSLTHDLTQVMSYLVGGDQGRREPTLLAGAGVLVPESGGMRFVRDDVVNLLMRLSRSSPLTVDYHIRDGCLKRLAWPLTDAAGSMRPAA